MTEIAVWGATPREWDLLLAGGMGEDLLPVVSAPGVPVAARSALKEVGKTPSLIVGPGVGEVVGLPGWTSRKVSPRDLAAWRRDNRLGLCLRTSRVRAIDVDVPDKTTSSAVRNYLEMLAGPLPVRWRENSGKLLMAFQLPGDMRKRVMTLPGGQGIIEFLANGQQFIAAGTHTSGVRYRWDGLDVLEVLGDWPTMDEALFEALWSGLAEVTGAAKGKPGRAPGAGPVGGVKARSVRDRSGDAVAEFLEERGWVVEVAPDGRLDINCPWDHEHSSEGVVSATSWFPAGVGGYMQGHFRCLHAHCADRTDEEFRDAIGFEQAQFEVLPALRPSEGFGGQRGTRAGVGAGAARGPGDEGEEDGEGFADGGAGEEGGEDWPRFERSKAGKILATATNMGAAVACKTFTGLRVGYDEFLGRLVVCDEVAGERAWRPVRDADYFDLRVRLEKRGFESTGTSKSAVRDALWAVGERLKFDSGLAWGRGLKWDGTPRVAGWLERYAGAVIDSEGRQTAEYVRAVSMYLWTALAGRLMSPGCQVDMVPVLVGGEGVGKTTLVESIAPEVSQFVEINLGHKNDAELAKSLRGKLVGEVAELRGLHGKEGEWIKAFITRRVEEFRELYVENTTQYPRRLVMIGTANQDQGERMLSQDGEDRRWLPVAVAGASEALRREFAELREQFWAEGVALWQQGEKTHGVGRGVAWGDAARLARPVREDYRSEDPWTQAVVSWLDAGDPFSAGGGAGRGGERWSGLLQAADVLVGALRIEPEKASGVDMHRLGRILRSLGFERFVRRVDGHNTKVWTRGGRNGHPKG